MIPYKCPVCNGTGLVLSGFYNVGIDTVGSSTTNVTEKCRSCNGGGIIHEDEDVLGNGLKRHLVYLHSTAGKHL